MTTHFHVEAVKYTITSDRPLFRYEQTLESEFDGKKELEFINKDFIRYKEAYNFFISKCALYSDRAIYKNGCQRFVKIDFYVVYHDGTSDKISTWDNLPY